MWSQSSVLRLAVRAWDPIQRALDPSFQKTLFDLAAISRPPRQVLPNPRLQNALRCPAPRGGVPKQSACLICLYLRAPNLRPRQLMSDCAFGSYQDYFLTWAQQAQ